MMKTKLFFLCGACLALVGTCRVGAEPFDESKSRLSFAQAHPELKKTITLTQQELPVDEAIIALSKASSINFIADVTQIPAMSRVAPFPASDLARSQKWTPIFSSVSADLALAAQLSLLSFDGTTVLMWKRPDVVETAQALIAANKLNVQPLPDEFGLSLALDDFWKNSTGWKQLRPDQPEDVYGEFRTGDLPLATRAPLLALARYAIVRPDWKREVLLSDSFWKTARVLVAPARNPFTGKTAPTVCIGGKDENGNATPFLRALFPFLLPLDTLADIQVYPAVSVGVDAPLPPVGEEIVAPAATGLTATQLEAEQTLQAPVSLEMNRQPLTTVLAGVAKQGGVTLSKSADVPAILVTARVQKMPLHELMGALGRLCNASWKQSATGYELQVRTLEPWQKLLLQSGGGDFQSQLAPNQLLSTENLERAIIDQVGEEQAAEGIPLSSLSDDVQAQLKYQLQDLAAFTLVSACNNAFVYAYPEGIVHLRRFPKTWRINLRASDNRNTLAMTDVRQPPPKKDAKKVLQQPEAMPLPDAP